MGLIYITGCTTAEPHCGLVDGIGCLVMAFVGEVTDSHCLVLTKNLLLVLDD